VALSAVSAAELALTNTTVVLNAAADGGAGGAAATRPAPRTVQRGRGAMAALVAASNRWSGSVTLANATISANSTGIGASGGGGGAVRDRGSHGTPVRVEGSRWARQRVRARLHRRVEYGPNCAGSLTDSSHNLSFPDTTCPGTTGDPKLGQLLDNGGPTLTMGLMPGSSAIDQIPSGCPPTDQRGVARPYPAGARATSGRSSSRCQAASRCRREPAAASPSRCASTAPSQPVWR